MLCGRQPNASMQYRASPQAVRASSLSRLSDGGEFTWHSAQTKYLVTLGDGCTRRCCDVASTYEPADRLARSDARAWTVRCSCADRSRRLPDCTRVLGFPASHVAYSLCLAHPSSTRLCDRHNKPSGDPLQSRRSLARNYAVMSALNRRLSCALVTAKVVLAGVGVIAVASTCLNGCASSGFYQMSDGWCMQHPAASPARCHGNPNDVVQVGRTYGSQHQSDGSRQQAGQEASAPLPAFVLSENSARESADEPYTGRSGAR